MITKIVFENWNLNFKKKKLRKVTYKNLLFKKINKTKNKNKICIWSFFVIYIIYIYIYRWYDL